MENWQKEHITRNSLSLLQLTLCSTELLEHLRSDGLLSDWDVEIIISEKTNHDKACRLYKILQTRTDAYGKLIKALTVSKQTGATDILLQIPLSMIKSLQVIINGAVHKLDALLNSGEVEAFHAKLQDNPVTKDFGKVDEMFPKQTTIQLVRETIPKPDPLYIPRLLSRRIMINPDIFQQNCHDVFVFKEAQQHNIRKYVTKYNIESSTIQLLQKNVTARFILLDAENDWTRICENTKTPAHLIRYIESTQTFLLQASKGGMASLNKFLESKEISECKYISEDEFVQTTLAEIVNGVCICDLPGMGKSLLVANIARKISWESPKSIVAFIQLRDLCLTQELLLDARQTVLEHISTSNFANQILVELANSRKIGFYLIFDGLDEVQESNQELTIEFLQKVCDTLPNCKIYVSSRLSLRSRIEEALGVISYDLKPFDEETQCSFLTTFWCQKDDACNPDKLIEYAQLCLHKIKEQLKEAENRITGVPLLCRLIAEVYSEKACLFADKHRKASVNLSENFANSLTEIYTSFVTRQLGHTQCNFACMFGVVSRPVQCDTACQIKSLHVWFAILTIFPKLASNMGIIVCDFKNLSNEQILKPGLLLLHKRIDNACRYAFLHRTFAEFIVAEFFATAIFSKNSPKWNSFCDMERYLQQWVFDEICDTNFTNPAQSDCISFRKNVVVYFFNDLLNMDPNYKDIACKVKFDIPKLPTAPSDPLASVPAYKPSSRLHYFCIMEACLIYNYEAILEILMQGTKNSSSGFLKLLLNNLRGVDSTVKMLYHAVRHCTVHVAQRLCDFYLEVFNFDLIKACSNLFSYLQPIRGAIERANYEMVVWCIDKIPNIPSDILYYCFGFDNYFADENLIQKRLEIAKLLIARRKNLLTEFPHGGNPLHQNFLHLKSIKFLITHKIDFRDNQDNFQPTIIHTAASYMCENDFLELVRFIFIDCSGMDLFEKYAVWNDSFLILEQVSDRCKVKMYISVLQIINNTENFTSVNENNMVEVLKDIVNLNPTFYSKYQKAFAALFYLTLTAGVVDVVDFLVSFDKCFLEFDYNKSPLLVAVAYKQLDVVKFLMTKGANIFGLSAENETILHVALRTRDCEWFYQIVKLLNIHWDHSETDNSRQSLHITSTNNISPVKKIPQKLYDMFNWEMNDYRSTPLSCAIYELELTPDFLDFFLTCGNAFPMEQDVSILVDLNFASPTNATIIQLAIERNQSLDFVKALVNRGADWAVKDKNGCNLVHLCTKYYLSEYIQYFLDKGLDVNELDSRKNNALQSFFFDYSHVICKRVQTFPEIFKILVNAGLNIENKNVWGQTVLHIAAMRGSSIHDDIFDFLKHNTNSDSCHKVDGFHSV